MSITIIPLGGGWYKTETGKIQLSDDDIKGGDYEITTVEAPESDEKPGNAGEKPATVEGAAEYVCVVHDRPMTPNPVDARYRWDCGGNLPGVNACVAGAA